MLSKFARFFQLLRDARSSPKLVVDLRYRDTEKNAEFFRCYTRDFYRQTRKRHPKCPVVRDWSIGVGVKEIEDDFDSYYMSLDGAARRNDKKARRNDYTFGRIDFNEWIDDVKAIVSSAEVRQGRPLPERLLRGEVEPNSNPPSQTRIHDYPFYGVEAPDGGGLAAYAGCFICGDVCMIESIYGHADHQSFGVVPMLIIGIAADLIENFPEVQYYVYGTVYGASESMRRFKRKMRFTPHRVTWVLG